MIAALMKLSVEFRESTIAQAARQRTPVQISDLREGPISPLHEIIVQAGYRALLAVPLLRPDGVVGALVVRRMEPGQFPKHAVDLLQTFAAQSVVAIRKCRTVQGGRGMAGAVCGWADREIKQWLTHEEAIAELKALDLDEGTYELGSVVLRQTLKFL